MPQSASDTPASVGMRVLILVENESVPHDGRVMAEARTLVANGYEVCVICPADPGESLDEMLEGFRVLRYKGAPARAGARAQIREYATALLQTQRRMIQASSEGGFDVVHACNPPDLFALSVMPYKLGGKRFIFDQHDLAPELYQSIYGRSTGLLMWGLRLTESISYRLADSVITVNESYAGLAHQRGHVPADRIFIVRNGPREGWPLNVRPDDSLKRGRTHLVLYLGVMGYQDGLDVLLTIVSHVVNDLEFADVHFALVGDGDAVADLRKLARDLGIDGNVEFVGWVADDELISTYLRTADACVCPEPSSPLNDKSTFVKVMEYMASGKPVVAFDLAETRVSAGPSAMYAPPGDLPAFARALVGVLSDPEQQREMAAAAAARLPELTWESQEPHLLAAYSKALEGIKASARRP